MASLLACGYWPGTQACGVRWLDITLGRVGVPDDIGGVIASLLQPDNRWVNAQRIEASGGMNL